MVSAVPLNDLRIPQGNRLDALAGNRAGQYRIRIKDLRRSRSLTPNDKISPIHPGEVLLEDFIEGVSITQNKLAISIGVPPRRINEIVHGKRGFPANTALRLARYFGTSAGCWLNLQSHYELD